MAKPDIETDYETVVTQGEVVQSINPHHQGVDCDCDTDLPHGNKRDVTVEYDSRKYYFYHQTPVVVKLGNGVYILANNGFRTLSTKKRINNRLPSGFKISQRDFEWYIETPEGELRFINGMTLDTK